jgi:hypothetical protein
VTELRDELTDQGVLSDLPQLLGVAEATARAVELDDSLTMNRIQQLVREHRDTLRGDIDGRSIPGEIERIDGIAFLRVDEERASELARWLVTGRDVADVRAGLLHDDEHDEDGETGASNRDIGDTGDTDADRGSADDDRTAATDDDTGPRGPSERC